MNDQALRPVVGIIVSLLIGAFVALAGSDGSTNVGWVPVFALCALLAYVINWIVFVPSNRAKTEHYFDLTGSATYLTVTAVALLLSDDSTPAPQSQARWSRCGRFALASFLFRRVRRDGRDGRFDKIKIDPLRFFMTWTLQGLWVLLTIAAALAIMTSSERPPARLACGRGHRRLGRRVRDRSGGRPSRSRPSSGTRPTKASSSAPACGPGRGTPTTSARSRCGPASPLMAIPVLSGWRWVVLISPVFVTLLLTKVSGIPMLEARAEKRWGGDKAYQAYTATTSVLLPRPPRR